MLVFAVIAVVLCHVIFQMMVEQKNLYQELAERLWRWALGLKDQEFALHKL